VPLPTERKHMRTLTPPPSLSLSLSLSLSALLPTLSHPLPSLLLVLKGTGTIHQMENKSEEGKHSYTCNTYHSLCMLNVKFNW